MRSSKKSAVGDGWDVEVVVLVPVLVRTCMRLWLLAAAGPNADTTVSEDAAPSRTRASNVEEYMFIGWGIRELPYLSFQFEKCIRQRRRRNAIKEIFTENLFFGVSNSRPAL